MSLIKDIVKGNNGVFFSHYFDGALWYNVDYQTNISDEQPNGEWVKMTFPVPIEDIGNATFHAEDKAMLFMRYIRKHLKTLEQ